MLAHVLLLCVQEEARLEQERVRAEQEARKAGDKREREIYQSIRQIRQQVMGLPLHAYSLSCLSVALSLFIYMLYLCGLYRSVQSSSAHRALHVQAKQQQSENEKTMDQLFAAQERAAKAAGRKLRLS